MVYSEVFKKWEILASELCLCLSNSMGKPMKLRCSVFNKVFLVNHCMIFLIVVANGYVLVTLIGALAENMTFVSV